ncbi:HMG-Y-related protein A [Euphorbia peplus]|nr:HMG-Y-related protein A [Euphorbia peplus]
MAALEDSIDFPQFEQQEEHTILPHYPEMIMAAIEALDEKEGSNKSAISTQIETTYPDLPPSHVTLLAHHLNKMKQNGQLVLVKNNYMKPDPNAPAKRGRGRPPKPKSDLPDLAGSGAGASSPRPRGRPPKMAKTEAGPVPVHVPVATDADSSVTEQKGVKRGRGRPPKVKPAVAPVAG